MLSSIWRFIGGYTFEDPNGNFFGDFVDYDEESSVFSYFTGYLIEIKWSNPNSKEENPDRSLFTSPFPNPFSNSTTIEYHLDEPAHVRIELYDAFGTEIAVVKDEFQPAGGYRACFEAAHYPPGVYYYRIQAGRQTESGKLVLVR